MCWSGRTLFDIARSGCLLLLRASPSLLARRVAPKKMQSALAACGLRGKRCVKLPRLRVAARKVREVLEQEFAKDADLANVVDLLGKEVVAGSVSHEWVSAKASDLGQKLVRALGGRRIEKDPTIGGMWNVELVSAFIDAAGDPESDLVAWLRTGCPAGGRQGNHVLRDFSSNGTRGRGSAGKLEACRRGTVEQLQVHGRGGRVARSRGGQAHREGVCREVRELARRHRCPWEGCWYRNWRASSRLARTAP